MKRYMGVQYRDFHTAIHHVCIFKTAIRARHFLLDLKDLEDPDVHGPIEKTLFKHAIDDIEVNFRLPPKEYRDGVLVIINADEVKPDLN